jgi:predicted Rossmann-fold nucleotide-binding protein
MPKYSRLVTDSAQLLASYGIPIATGGAGGFMERANTAAWLTGAESIGIPMGGSYRLDTERRTASDVQTLTVPASSYETRIPLLLYRRPIIVNAPGGDGTRREIATEFVALAGNNEGFKRHLLFLSSEHYEAILTSLFKSPFPESFLKRVHVVDDKKELEDRLTIIGGDPELNIELLRSNKPLVPRKAPEEPSYFRRERPKPPRDSVVYYSSLSTPDTDGEPLTNSEPKNNDPANSKPESNEQKSRPIPSDGVELKVPSLFENLFGKGGLLNWREVFASKNKKDDKK